MVSSHDQAQCLATNTQAMVSSTTTAPQRCSSFAAAVAPKVEDDVQDFVEDAWEWRRTVDDRPYNMSAWPDTCSRDASASSSADAIPDRFHMVLFVTRDNAETAFGFTAYVTVMSIVVCVCG